MSKIYEISCWYHGRVRIEVEKPPIIGKIMLKCPFCGQMGRMLMIKEVARGFPLDK